MVDFGARRSPRRETGTPDEHPTDSGRPTQLDGGCIAPNLGAYHVAFLTAAGIALLGVGAALRIHDRDAASTMVPAGKVAGEVARAQPVAV